MTTLSGILGMMLLAIIIGENTKNIRLESYILVVALVLVEVFFILLKMYTMNEPGL